MKREERSAVTGAGGSLVSPKVLNYYAGTEGVELGHAFWPNHPRELAKMIEVSLRGYLDLALQDPDGVGDILLAGQGALFGFAWGCYEKILCLEAAARSGFRVNGDSSVFSFLDGSVSTLPDVPVPPWLAKLPISKRSYLRSSVTELFRRSSFVAFSGNPLIKDVADSANWRTRLVDPKIIIRRARRTRHHVPSEKAERAALLASENLVESVNIAEPFAGRLRQLLQSLAAQIFRLVDADLAALANVSGLPMDVLCGTGGSYPARIIGMEIRHRGGNVRRFDHGGSTGITSPFSAFELNELAVSSEFFMATENLARLVSGGLDRSDLSGNAMVVGGRGFPQFRGLPLNRGRLPSSRPKVLYAPSFTRNDRKNPAHAISESVYSHWVLHITKTLSSLSVDLTCKPHPAAVRGNAFHGDEIRDRPYILDGLARISTQPFEDIMSDADVFVFDVVNSTIFWEALCTTQPVVYIDLGYTTLLPEIFSLIEKRCVVISANYDGNNIPRIDASELSAAVSGNLEQRDPTAMRELFLGPSLG